MSDIAKKRIPSTIIISILVLINLYVVIVGFIPLEIKELLSGGTGLEEPDEITLIWGAMAVGIVLLAFVGWAVLIAVTHAFCLAFTIRNRKSSLISVRIINLVLDVANAFLIIAPVVKIFIWTIFVSYTTHFIFVNVIKAR